MKTSIVRSLTLAAALIVPGVAAAAPAHHMTSEPKAAVSSQHPAHKATHARNGHAKKHARAVPSTARR